MAPATVPPSITLANATLVLPDAVRHGALVVADGRIAAIGDDARAPGALDLDGDYLLPGLIDLHTDNLERQVLPRSNARWPSRSALLAHDAHCAAAGITTVLDALCLGDLGFEPDRHQTFLDGIADLDALAPTGLLRAEHFLHLRCEMPAPGMPALLERVADHPRLRLASLMDHTPGIGQYGDVAHWRALRRRDGLTDAQIDAQIAGLLDQRARHRDANRAAVLARLGGRVPLASHDDATADEVAAGAADGLAVSEFPVTEAAARAAPAHGMAVIAGAPNIVRGGSHAGNVAAASLVRAGLVDALASDYMPAALIEATFACAGLGLGLPAAVRLVTDAPARIAGLDDRGRLAPGLRADLIRVRLHDGLPVIRAVWRAGERVA